MSARAERLRGALVVAILGGSLLWVLGLDPIPQDPAYHEFADQRVWLGIANFADVVSNLAFLVVGVWALARSRGWVAGEARRSWLVMFAGVALVSVGSGYYHLDPSNETLVWDRLPMTVGFMGLLVALLTEHAGPGVQRFALVPAVAIGAASVLYWHLTDDLRPYVWVQLGPLLAIPTVLLAYPARYTHAGLLWVGLACYVTAKVTETYDAAIFAMTGEMVSGHTLKHLFAALGPACLHLMLVRRARRPEHRRRYRDGPAIEAGSRRCRGGATVR